MLEINNISYSYNTPEGSTEALKNISANIRSGITAVIGHTGSGKSTLAEIVSGVTKPNSGTITLDGAPVNEISDKIGIVFQYPEHQLFAETVYEDIAYGLSRKRLNEELIKKRVLAAAQLVGIDEKRLSMSPFHLSGGQQRMAALAGILILEPKLLVLDEPAAGLDPSAKCHMFEILRMLIQNDPSMTIVFITHSMEDAAEYASDILLLDKGRLIAHEAPEELFTKKEMLEQYGLTLPAAACLAEELRRHNIDIGQVFTEDAAAEAILKIYKGGIGNAS